MTWVTRFAALMLLFVAPAFADTLLDITGNNVIIPSATLNFSFEFDATTDNIVGTAVFTATGSQQFVTALNLSQLVFQSAVTNAAGIMDLNFAGPSATPGITTFLSLGPNGLQASNPADLAFPAVGVYNGSIVLIDAGYLGSGGSITITDPPSVPVPEPSAILLLVLGFLVFLGAKALPTGHLRGA